MGDVHYMISEAAKQVGVEPHALRYWEDELALKIGRTEMGHRYYTGENIRLFSCIKKLKEQGISLKEIKAVIPDMIHTKNELRNREKQTAAEHTALLLKEKENQDEEHYRNLDVLIRRQQKLRRGTGKSRFFRRSQKKACPV